MSGDERIPGAFLVCYNISVHMAEQIIATLRAHEAELRQAGLRSVSLFGSVARGETEMDSDIDLAAEFDPAARMDLLRLTALERRIAELLGTSVDLLPEPVQKPRLQDQINRDRLRAF
jgi:predicted nucleotidyltransferase